jgi:hypothetical protein
MPVEHSENIVRGVFTNDWDDEQRRISPSFFKGQGTSVSRLALASLGEHWDLFRTQENPPERELKLISEINVGELHQIGQSYVPSTPLSVEPKPEDWNPAHAEIPERITKGLSRQIGNRLRLHSP